MLRYIRWYAEDPSRLIRAIHRRMPGVISSGSRAVTRRVHYRGLNEIRKDYNQTPAALQCLQNELKARQVFADQPWIIPVKEHGSTWLSLPMLPEDSRLDVAAKTMDDATRRQVVHQAMSILLDIYCAGYLHGDFHTCNLFWFQDQLLVGDFEKLTAYPEDCRPAFRDSYDLRGVANGIFLPGNPGVKPMHYATVTGHGKSLEEVLGIPLDAALDFLNQHLMDELHTVCRTFQAQRDRHQPRAGRIYSSFTLPHFTVKPEAAQRDSAKRLERLGIQAADLQNASLLDLGCNIGGMIFESQKYLPARCLGVEYDRDKVAVATRIAGLNGLQNVRFVEANVDTISPDDLQGPYDVVYCLALIAHVQMPDELYRRLAEVTRRTLYFEGNRKTNPLDIEANLLENGFRTVEHLGACDDDCMPDNNTRPIYVARK